MKTFIIFFIILLLSITGFSQTASVTKVAHKAITIVSSPEKTSITEGMVYPKFEYSIVVCAKLPDSISGIHDYPDPFFIYIDFNFWWIQQYLSYAQVELIMFDWNLILKGKDLGVKAKAFRDIREIIEQGIENTLTIKKPQESIFKKVIVYP